MTKHASLQLGILCFGFACVSCSILPDVLVRAVLTAVVAKRRVLAILAEDLRSNATWHEGYSSETGVRICEPEWARILCEESYRYFKAACVRYNDFPGRIGSAGIFELEHPCGRLEREFGRQAQPACALRIRTFIIM